MYRPPDWKGYIEKLADKNGIDVRTQSILIPMDDDSVEVYEAGADAIIQSLISKPSSIKVKQYHEYYCDKLTNGTWVFIPDNDNVD